MPWIAAAASVAGGLLSSNAASSAADSQQAATGAAVAENRRQFDFQRADRQPAIGIGNNALQRLAGLYGVPYSSPGNTGQAAIAGTPGTPATPGHWAGTTFGRNGDQQWMAGTPGTPGTPGQAAIAPASGQPQTYNDGLDNPVDPTRDPGYQFGLQQGQLALDRQAAASGGRVSGAALKGATEYATNYATTGYNAAYQRREDRLNRLQALAGIGQTATGGSAWAGTSAGNANAQLLSSQGDAMGASQLARGNIWSNTGNQLAALFRNNSGSPNNFGSVPYNANTTIPMQPGGGY